MDLALKDKVAAVTGGSRGIGKAIAAALAREGVDVALIARDLGAAEAAASEIAQASGRRVQAYRADTGEDADVKAAFAAIDRDFGRLDILVNAAAKPGGQATTPKFADITNEDLWAEMNVKVMGYLRCVQAAAPLMRRNAWGRIVNISGLAARTTGTIIGSMRNVSVVALTKNLAEELGPSGINVTCVHPGITRTEKTPALVARRAAAEKISEGEMERRMSTANIIRRMVTAEEVADVVAFLASPKSVAINGEVIAAGGGQPGPIFYS